MPAGKVAFVLLLTAGKVAFEVPLVTGIDVLLLNGAAEVALAVALMTTGVVVLSGAKLVVDVIELLSVDVAVVLAKSGVEVLNAGALVTVALLAVVLLKIGASVMVALLAVVVELAKTGEDVLKAGALVVVGKVPLSVAGAVVLLNSGVEVLNADAVELSIVVAGIELLANTVEELLKNGALVIVALATGSELFDVGELVIIGDEAFVYTGSVELSIG